MAPRGQQTGAASKHFIGVVARDFGKAPVDTQDDVLGVGDEHALLRFKGGGGDALGFLGLLSLRQIGHRRHAHDLALVVHHLAVQQGGKG